MTRAPTHARERKAKLEKTQRTRLCKQQKLAAAPFAPRTFNYSVRLFSLVRGGASAHDGDFAHGVVRRGLEGRGEERLRGVRQAVIGLARRQEARAVLARRAYAHARAGGRWGGRQVQITHHTNQTTTNTTISTNEKQRPRKVETKTREARRMKRERKREKKDTRKRRQKDYRFRSVLR